jgi:hypothetical protein
MTRPISERRLVSEIGPISQDRLILPVPAKPPSRPSCTLFMYFVSFVVPNQSDGNGAASFFSSDSALQAARCSASFLLRPHAG